MKSKTTAIWFALAASLFAFLWVAGKYFQPAAPANNALLSGLRAGWATEIHVIPAGAREVTVGLTNKTWQLLAPAHGPAQSSVIQVLLHTLETLTPASRITPAELTDPKNADAEYGFTNPRFTLALNAGDQQWQLRLGKLTPLGDQVYVRVVGVDTIFVTDAAWLQMLPHTVNDWRDTALVSSTANIDWIVITNGTKAIELHRDPSNHLWRITRPLPARADTEHVTALLQSLGGAQSSRFVTDDSRADLAGYGLQPAELDVWLGRDTNLLTAIHAGKPTTDNPDQVYARREGLDSVVAVADEVLAPWRGAVNDFRDPHLLPRLVSPVNEIELVGAKNILLRNQGSNHWQVAGEKFPVDLEKIEDFVKLVDGLHIAEFVKDNNTPADLSGFGLNPPGQSIILRAQAGDTNSTIARLCFGATDTNRIFVKCDGENSVYALAKDDLVRMPEGGWDFRDRHIWNFAATNITRIVLNESGKTRTFLQVAAGKWLLAAGSSGGNKDLNLAAVDQAARYLSQFTVTGWVERNVTNLTKFSLRPENLQITLELKTGEKYTTGFGLELPSANTALAAVNLDGETWVYVFPPTLFQYVLAALTIPPDARQ